MTQTSRTRIPLILDTDIGYDIDDTWALAMLLKSPEVDLKLVVSETNDTTYCSKLLAKMLTIAKRTDVPVGVGIKYNDTAGGQAAWVENYDLSSYAGKVHEDGVGALIETIMNSPEPITLCCIGPVPNIAAALEREPRIAERTRFVGMHGCLWGDRSGNMHAEYNVKCFVPAAQKVFAAPWQGGVTITPLDTCSHVVLTGERYRKVRDCQDPVVQALMDNYRYWAKYHQGPNYHPDPETRSTELYDTVAVYLTFSEELLVMEELGIRVTDDGFTRIDKAAKKLRCATEWKNLAAYEDFLVKRLTGE